MKAPRLLRGLFGRKKAARRPPPKSEAEKARELEQLIQVGVAANRFPPR
jgi:hypothetical protein